MIILLGIVFFLSELLNEIELLNFFHLNTLICTNNPQKCQTIVRYMYENVQFRYVTFEFGI